MDITYENKTSAISFSLDKTLANNIHIHKELEIIYVKHGKAVAYADKNSYLLNEGDLFFTFPNQIHYYQTLKSGEFGVLIFSPSIIYGEGKEISKSIPNTNYIPSENNEIANIIARISNANGKYRYLALNGYINTLMSIILPKLTLKTITGEKNSAFYSIIDFCSRNFRDNITLDYVAESLHLSKYYISHLINKRLNQNFSEYVNNLRISEACNLLKETDAKIADISEDVGFGTIRSFNRSFKQTMGVSPAEYRSDIDKLKELI